MNTKNTHTAKFVQMRPKPLRHQEALESIFASLEEIEKKLANHFER